MSESTIIYSCHPIMSLMIGEYKFEKSRLEFANEKAAEGFQTLLDSLPMATQRMVRKVSIETAEEIAARIAAGEAKATNQVTSATLRAASEVANAKVAADKANAQEIPAAKKAFKL